MLAAPVSRFRVCDACRLAAEQSAQRIAALPDCRSLGEWCAAREFFRGWLEDDRQSSNLLLPRVLYVAYRSESSTNFFTFSPDIRPDGADSGWYPLRGGLPDPARYGQVPRSGTATPRTPRAPLPATPGQPGGQGRGGPVGGVGGGILTALTRLVVGGRGGPPPSKTPPKKGGKKTAFSGKTAKFAYGFPRVKF